MAKVRAIIPAEVLILVVLMILSCFRASVAAPSAAQCKEERRLGVNACKPVLYGKLPSPECCERVRVTDVECVCQVITRKLAALIDVNRAVRLIEGCGRRVPRHGVKCGIINKEERIMKMIEMRGKSSISCMLQVLIIVAALCMIISSSAGDASINCKQQRMLGIKACMGLLKHVVLGLGLLL